MVLASLITATVQPFSTLFFVGTMFSFVVNSLTVLTMLVLTRSYKLSKEYIADASHYADCTEHMLNLGIQHVATINDFKVLNIFMILQ